jgi:hypothetical protein
MPIKRLREIATQIPIFCGCKPRCTYSWGFSLDHIL